MTTMNARPAHSAREPLAWIGLAGVGPDDSATARLWQQRLHWPMVGIALLSLPAYILDTSDLSAGWHRIATVIDAAVFLAFALELAWMLSVTRQPFRYLVGNWLNLVVLLGTGAALFGAASEAVALIRVARIATAGFILLRAVAELRVLFTRRGAPLLFGAAFLSILTGGTLFYALDPTIHSVWDGMWLAFVTGATVGYGDLVPTTGATRVVAVFVVLAGWALLSLFTANIVAMFVGREETELRAEMREEMRELRGALVRLAAAMEAREEQARDDRAR